MKPDDDLLGAWERGERARAAEEELRHLLRNSERESRLLFATEPDAVDLDGVQESVAGLAVAYLASPARPMLKQGIALRQELSRRVTLGAIRPRELRDMYLALGRVSGVLAYAALDLGDSAVARVHGETVWRMADLAGNNELRAWVRGTQSLISRFEKCYDLAQWYIADGLRFAGDGTSEIRLLCGAAQCAANLGDSAACVRNTQNAQDARERGNTDRLEGLFGFSPAKQQYYSASALMWITDKRSLQLATRSAVAAIEAWQHEPPEQRSLDDEALAHVYLATARLRLGEVDGAMDAVRPVINLPAERQISWIHKRVGELSHILGEDRFKHSRTARDARTELQAYKS